MTRRKILSNVNFIDHVDLYFTEARLYRKLLDNRLPVRPRPNGTEPTQIYVAFYLNQIKELVRISMTFIVVSDN